MAIDWTVQWHRTWVWLGLPVPPAQALAALMARYSEPQRHYHTLQHLDECFASFDQLCNLADQPGEIALAIWLHDAVYDPRRGDNEARSADLAADTLRTAGAGEALVARVAALIMATQDHAAPADNRDCAILLGILGAGPALCRVRAPDTCRTRARAGRCVPGRPGARA